MEEVVAEAAVPFPYVPGLLSFREAPVVLECFARLARVPEVVLVDGQGIAHPRAEESPKEFCPQDWVVHKITS